MSDATAAELLEVVVACCTASPDGQAQLLVRTRDTIVKLLPVFQDGFLPESTGLDQFEDLIKAGAYESAAIRLLGSKVGYMASRSPSGVYLATVYVPGVDELAISAASLALCLSAGLLTALRILGEEAWQDEAPAAAVRFH